MYVEYIKRVLFLYPSSYINATMFNRVGAVILLVSDMKKSKEFYNNVMGMEINSRLMIGLNFQNRELLSLYTRQRKRSKTNR